MVKGLTCRRAEVRVELDHVLQHLQNIRTHAFDVAKCAASRLADSLILHILLQVLSITSRIICGNERHILLIDHLSQFLQDEDELICRAHNVLLIRLLILRRDRIAGVTWEQCHEPRAELGIRREVFREGNTAHKLSNRAAERPNV